MAAKRKRVRTLVQNAAERKPTPYTIKGAKKPGRPKGPTAVLHVRTRARTARCGETQRLGHILVDDPTHANCPACLEGRPA